MYLVMSLLFSVPGSVSPLLWRSLQTVASNLTCTFSSAVTGFLFFMTSALVLPVNVGVRSHPLESCRQGRVILFIEQKMEKVKLSISSNSLFQCYGINGIGELFPPANTREPQYHHHFDPSLRPLLNKCLFFWE